MTDQYTQAESRVAKALAELTTYITEDYQIMNGDESGLAKGAEYFIRLHPGNFSDTEVAAGEASVDWQIELKIYVRFKELQASWDAFRAFRWAVMYKILQHPSLNRITGLTDIPGYSHVSIGTGEMPVYIVVDPEVADPTPLFISQTLTVTVHQTKIAITGGEYA